MGLLDEMIETFDKEGLAGEIYRKFYRTGIDYLDYMNGKVSAETGELELGVCGGKILLIPGWSGSGKTTVAIQVGWNIVKDEEEGLMLFYDPERGTSHERLAQVTVDDLDYYLENLKNKKIRLTNDDVASEDLTELIDKIYRIKMTSGCQVAFIKDGSLEAKTNKTKMRDAAAELPPTVIIVDSWAAMFPREMSEMVKVAHGMFATARAKANNAVVDQAKDKMYRANIILIVVNHVQKSVDTNQYAPDSRPLKYLKEEETLPGGGRVCYYADYAPRLEQKAKLTPDKEFGIKGFLQECIICKSRNNASGITITMVFDQFHGVDNLLTNFLILQNNNGIGGSGHGYFLKAYPDAGTFKKKTLHEIYDNDQEFSDAFDAAVAEILDGFIRAIEAREIDQVEDEYVIEPDDIRKMTRTRLKEYCEDQEVDIDWSDYKGKDGLKEAAGAIIEFLFEEE